MLPISLAHRHRSRRYLATSATLLLDIKRSIKFSKSLEPVESSIHTMEKILTILHDAESQSHDVQTSSPELPHKYSRTGFAARFDTSLGNDVFEFSVTKVLNKLQIVNEYDIFQTVSTETAESIYRQYMNIIKDRYTWKVDPDVGAMEKLGRSFAENPLPTLASLSSQIDKLCGSLLVGGIDLSNKQQFQFDFPYIRIDQPIKQATSDPLILRKGLGMRRHPLTLLAFMVNDPDVIRGFLKRSRSKIPVLKIEKFMVAQSLEGSQAFKIIVKRYLRGSDPSKTIHSPFEGYHSATSNPESDSDIEIVKAIVASKSRLLDRLLPYRDYHFSFLRMHELSQDTNEKVVKILADLFDRYFGICYKKDARYCDEWVQNLIEFYLANELNEELFERLFKDSINNFRQIYSNLANDKFKLYWVTKERRAAEKKEREKKWRDRHAVEIIRNAQSLIADSTQSHGKLFERPSKKSIHETRQTYSNLANGKRVKTEQSEREGNSRKRQTANLIHDARSLMAGSTQSHEKVSE